MNDGQQLSISLQLQLERYLRNFEKAQANTDKRFRAIEARTKLSGERMEKTLAASSSRIAGMFKTFGAGVLGGIVAGLSVAGLTQIIERVGKVAEGVANIGSAAKRAGIDVRAFQELSFVADQNRIGIDALTDGMKELQNRADEFIVTGKGPAAEAFARIGLSAVQLRDRLRDPAALLVEIIRRMEQLDRAAQIRIAEELFGGTAGERFVELLDRGAAGIRQQIEEAHRLGVILDADVIRRADEIDRRFKAIAATVATEMKGAVVTLAGAMLDWWDSLNNIEEQQSRTIQLRLADIYQRIADEKAKLDDLESEKRAFPGDAAIDLNIDRQKQLVEELTNEALRLRDVLDRRDGYKEGFIYKTGDDAKTATPAVTSLNNALTGTGSAGNSAVSGINSYADAIRALKAEIPELVEGLEAIDRRARIDVAYKQALNKARTIGETIEAAKLRDAALLALASAPAREAASRGMLDLIGYAEGTDRGRGYNETLGYGRFTGGSQNLVLMSLDQIDQLQSSMLAHPDNGFNSSALGRYQITQRTLRGLRDRLGLSGAEFFDADMQDRLAEELLRQRGNDVAGLRNEWEGLRRIDDATIRSAYDGTLPRIPAIDPGKSANIEAAREQAAAYVEIVSGAKQYTQQMQFEQQALDMTAVRASALRFEQQMLNDAQQRGVTLTPQQRAEIQQLAMGMAQAEQAAASYAETQQQAAETSRFFGEQAVDALSGILTGTTNVEDALRNIINALIKATLQAAILGEGPLAGLFSGKGFSGGGGGKSKGAGGFLASILGFAEGGYTGPGGKHEPAGVVHRGEFVMSKAATSRIGVGNLEALHQSALRGYAGGGLVGKEAGGQVARMLSAGNDNSVNQPIAITNNVTVNTNGGGSPEANADLAKKMSRELEATMRGVVADELRRQTRPGNTLSRYAR